MGFVVTENKKKSISNTNNGIILALEEVIDGITADDICRDGKRSEIGLYRVDITPASNDNMLVQMQSGSKTYASATYSRNLVNVIDANFPDFKTALKGVLTTCQKNGFNTVITWVDHTSPATPSPAPAAPRRR